ncbi:hypothetical protein KFE98_11645 [bacterium SCSIO 12741]|nr:hypothetical protein KFE98_11645 [bacterium SCSIO 12741]
MRPGIFLFFVLFIGLASCGGSPSNSEVVSPVEPVEKEEKEAYQVQIMFYNVENLFDTIDNPKTKDEEFTPDSDKKWGLERYQTKLDRLAQVVLSVDSMGPVAVLGLAEVENRAVLEDLIAHPSLANRRWGIVHEQSPDFRGIDVALIYDSAWYQPNGYDYVTVKLPNSDRTTRDILKVTGQLKGGEQMAFFVNHWPSRYGGQEASEPGRIAAAKVLRKEVSAYDKRNPDGNFVAMGDFNDYPTNKSVQEILGAGWGMSSLIKI